MSKNIAITYEFDKYLDLSQSDSYNLFRDEKNFVILRRFLIFYAIIMGIIVLVSFAEKGFTNPASYAYLLLFIAAIVLRLIYKNKINVSNIRKVLFFFLVTIFIAHTSISILKNFTYTPPPKKDKTENVPKDTKQKGIVINDNNDEDTSNVTNLVFFFSLIILFFKFSRNEVVQLYTLAFGIPLITELLVFTNFSLTDKFISLFIAVIIFIVAYSAETMRRRKFLSQLKTYSKRHLESHRMKKELDYAREIQLSMLPSGDAKFGDLEIAATSVPTYEVGGDYFDYFKISDNLIGVFICDVSGHGVASALLLSGLRSCMHLILEETTNPKEVFIKLNRMIRKTQNKKMFVTAIFAVIDLEKNTCSLFNAGHLPPYKISGNSNELFKIRRHGITLGAVDDISQDMGETEVVFDFNKNDKLVFYTDGVSEAMNSGKKEYGFEKLENFLNSNANKSPVELMNLLIKDVNTFTSDTEQKDDMSIMVLGRN